MLQRLADYLRGSRGMRGRGLCNISNVFLEVLSDLGELRQSVNVVMSSVVCTHLSAVGTSHGNPAQVSFRPVSGPVLPEEGKQETGPVSNGVKVLRDLLEYLAPSPQAKHRHPHNTNLPQSAALLQTCGD